MNYSFRRWIRLAVALGLAGAILGAAGGMGIANADPANVGTEIGTSTVRGSVNGIGIVENRGQQATAVQYYASSRDVTVYFTRSAIVLDLQGRSDERQDFDPADTQRNGLASSASSGLDTAVEPRRGCAVWLQFAGAGDAPTIEASGQKATRYNYFLGDDPAAWRSNVPLWSEIVYRDLWPGIELSLWLDGSRLCYEVAAAPGADPDQVAFACVGAQSVTRTFVGDLIDRSIETPLGTITQVSSRAGCGSFSWSGNSGQLLREFPRVDNPPALIWSTLLGDTAGDKGVCIIADSAGLPLASGRTRSPNFPATPGSYETTHTGANDAFITKLAADGASVLWSTFLGGDLDDVIMSIDIDPNENIVVTGAAASANFPTTAGVFQEDSGGLRDGFVAKFDPTGSDLLFSSYLGGGLIDGGTRIKTDHAGYIVVVGSTNSSDLPTTPGALAETHNGVWDAFVARIDPPGTTLLSCTYLGGEYDDLGQDLALDLAGRAVVTGGTRSPGFPTTPGAYATELAGGQDVFITKLDHGMTALEWGTLLGDAGDEDGYRVVLDDVGQVIVTGGTESPEFPVTNDAFDDSYNGIRDCFVARLDQECSDLLWCTFLGGSETDKGMALNLDTFGHYLVSGYTHSDDMPTTLEAYDRSYNGSFDVFMARIDATSNTLIHCTYLGGEGRDETYSTALDADGNPMLIGMAHSWDFPVTPGAFDETYSGEADVFVAKLALSYMVPTAVVEYLPAAPLFSVFPNPFNPTTSIRFELPNAGEVSLIVYDVAGRQVRALLFGRVGAGSTTVSWDGRDDDGEFVSSGLYFCRLQAERFAQMRKVMLVR